MDELQHTNPQLYSLVQQDPESFRQLLFSQGEEAYEEPVIELNEEENKAVERVRKKGI